MKQPKKHTHNYIPTWKTNHEVNEDPSETIQDEAYTVRSLYEKFVNNVPLPNIHQEGLYEDEPDLDNPPINKHPTYDPLEDRKQQDDFIKSTKQKAKKLEEAKNAETLKNQSEGLTSGNDKGSGSEKVKQSENDPKLAPKPLEVIQQVESNET